MPLNNSTQLSDSHMPAIFLKSTQFETPLGTMLAIADETHLYLLEFTDRIKIDHQLKSLHILTNASIIPGITAPLISIQQEIGHYFAGTLQIFKTPLYSIGTPFQEQAWHALTTIPYGQTRSYKEQAITLGNARAMRAVGKANSTNRLAIIIPCHRVINANGKLGGYAGSLSRKEWLLKHEQHHNA